MDKKVVGLKYGEGDYAPLVIVKGKNQTVEQILKEANKLGLPIIENSKEVEVLYNIDEGNYIPKELYEVVASIYKEIINGCENYREKN